MPPGRRGLGDDVQPDPFASIRAPSASFGPASSVTPEPNRMKQPISPPPNLSLQVSPQSYPKPVTYPPLVMPPSNAPALPGQLTTAPTLPSEPGDRPSLTIAPVPQRTVGPPPMRLTAPAAPAKSHAWMWILGGLVAAGGVGTIIYVATRPKRPRRRG